MKILIGFLVIVCCAKVMGSPLQSKHRLNTNFDELSTMDDFVIYMFTPTNFLKTADNFSQIQSKHFEIASPFYTNPTLSFLDCFGLVSYNAFPAEGMVNFFSNMSCAAIRKSQIEKIDQFLATQKPQDFYGNKLQWSKPKVITYQVLISAFVNGQEIYQYIYKSMKGSEIVALSKNLSHVLEPEQPKKSGFLSILKDLGFEDQQLQIILNALNLPSDSDVQFALNLEPIVDDGIMLPYYSRVGFAIAYHTCHKTACFQE